MKKEAYTEDAPMERSTPALKIIAAHLIKWREDLGLTAEDIAQRGNVDMDYIERVEKGRGETPEFLVYVRVLMKATPKIEGLKRWEKIASDIFGEASKKHKPERNTRT